MASTGILLPWLDTRSSSLNVPLLVKMCADNISARAAVEALLMAHQPPYVDDSTQEIPQDEEHEHVVRAKK
jgi:hypothetical protein